MELPRICHEAWQGTEPSGGQGGRWGSKQKAQHPFPGTASPAAGAGSAFGWRGPS